MTRPRLGPSGALDLLALAAVVSVGACAGTAAVEPTAPPPATEEPTASPEAETPERGSDDLRPMLYGVDLDTVRAGRFDQGKMWTFEFPPVDYLRDAYGFEPDATWFERARLGALRIPSCSASFVSPHGLVLTNHHCAREFVSQVSEPGEALLDNGLVSRDLADERPLEDFEADQLVDIVDVTDEVNTALDALPVSERPERREALLEEIRTRLLDDRGGEGSGFEVEMISLYDGARTSAYVFRRYTSARLVVAPELQIGFFGGDPDNFTYPRYSIDFAFVRAYEDGKPADTTKCYFKWKMGGAKEGDLVFIPGNPGSTQRLYTKAQMEYERDKRMPILKQQYDQQLAVLRSILRRYGPRMGEAFTAQVKNWVLQYENGQKAFGGELSGLRDAKLMAQKEAAEKAFRARVNAKKELREKFGKVWDRLADVAQRRTALEAKLRFQTHDYCRALRGAVLAVRAKDPKEPEDKRKENKKKLLGDAPRMFQDNIITIPMFMSHMDRAKDWLEKDDPFLTEVLGEKGSRGIMRALLGSKIAQPGFREDLMEGSWEDLQKNEDPAIQMAVKLAPLMRANEAEDEKLKAIEEAQGALLGQALFACYGTKVSPDATMTLRFSDGVVKGYPCNGTVAPYRTTFYGLFGRSTEFDNEYPFDLPEPWIENKSKIDLSKSVNFVSTNDITGGNSGSVVVSKDLRVVGLVFDGNIESLPNNYVFRDDIPRSVCVHVDAIMEAMKKVYEAKRVVDELTAK